MAPNMQAKTIRDLQLAVEKMRRALAAQTAPLVSQLLMAPQAPEVPQAPQAPPVHHAASAMLVIEQFFRYQPLTFDGENDPLTAEEWLQTFEKKFRHIACPEN
ncbi:Uncharacterized protein Adt_20935 [Abeliophyllum distichum]|uniref:Uncharacterized protein n=1 Tax=Abeliophyllum distichum TaxID=126358 RepID=A0ABD1SXW4_9LAMI